MPAAANPHMISEPYRLIAQLPEKGAPGTPFVLSNSFTRMDSGAYIVGAPLYASAKDGKAAHGCGIEVFRSRDKGETWERTGNVSTGGVIVEVLLFTHAARLYMLIAHRKEGECVLELVYSGDEGSSWSRTYEVLRGPHRWISLHQLEMLVENDILYLAGSEALKNLLVIACDLRRDILSPAAWRVSNSEPMPVPEELKVGVPAGSGMTCLEGNILSVAGKKRVYARAIVDKGGTANLCAIFDLEDEGGELRLTFRQFYPLPGGQCKFYILFDEQTKLYWMASNIAVNPQMELAADNRGNPIPKTRADNDRRNLLLWYSCDCLSWFPAGWIAKAEKLSQSFMYPSMFIDGGDLALLSRTSLESGSFHDADALTFHRIPNFRALALDIWPK